MRALYAWQLICTGQPYARGFPVLPVLEKEVLITVHISSAVILKADGFKMDAGSHPDAQTVKCNNSGKTKIRKVKTAENQKIPKAVVKNQQISLGSRREIKEIKITEATTAD